MRGWHDLAEQLEGADPLRRSAGSYAILLEPHERCVAQIGRLGAMTVEPGILVYVGSAQGPGGVAARCAHHLRITRRPHWHLDYLRPHCHVLGVWAAYGSERLEHRWARALSEHPDARIPVKGFGATDCTCTAHLLHLRTLPSPALLKTVFDAGVWAPTTGGLSAGR